MTRGISPDIEKLRNPNLSQLNVEGLTWKKNINYTNNPKQKKISIKKIRIKIEIQNKFYF